MSINSNNIDKWLFDYYEGNLSPDDIRKLEQFLKKNPEYYEDAEAWKDSFVEESLPAFNTAFLVKETESKKNRRALAYAALLLLLLTSAVAIYYIVPSAVSSKGSSSASSSAHGQSQKHNTVFASNENGNNTSAVTLQHSTSSNTVTSNNSNGLSFTPEISKLEEMVTTYNSAPVQPNQIIINQYYNNNGTGNTVVRQTLNNQNKVFTNGLMTNANVNASTNNQADLSNTVNQEQNTVTDLNTNTHDVNNITDNNNHVTGNNNETASNLSADPINNVLAEDINLTIENTAGNNEIGKEANPEKQNGNTVSQENKDNKAVTTDNRTSDLNPDALMANAKKDEQKKIAEPEKDKTKIPTDVKGIGFTNRRQVTLLQNINSEFENNASFITQHYVSDVYAGGHFSNASPFEKGSGGMLGMSQYFRKAKTTVNAYGFYDKMGYVQQTGLNLQMATQFKLDRYQIIIPSVSLSTTGYQFQQVKSSSDVPSYSAGLLTGTTHYNNYQNTTKFNLSAGMLYHHKKFFAGLSMNGLLQPKFRYQNLDRNNANTNYATVSMIAGTDFVSKNRPELSLSPQMIITVRNMEAEFSGGAVLRYQSWGVGAGFTSSGAINGYAGYSNRMFSIQYRYMYDKLDAPFRGISGHYLTTHFNLKSFVRKQKPILDSEK